VLSSQPDWFTMNLALPSAKQVPSVLGSFGAERRVTRERQRCGEALRTGRPAVGHLMRGPVTEQSECSVRVPMVRNGVTTSVLSAVVKPQAISRLLSAGSSGETGTRQA
jgi:hypothetical protein